MVDIELYVPIEHVRMNCKKLRKLSWAKVAKYERDFEAGDNFPPIRVSDIGGAYAIRDGRHRYQAQLSAGYLMIAVEVVNARPTPAEISAGVLLFRHLHIDSIMT